MANLNFPTNPSDGDTYEGYVYNAAKGVWQWQVLDPVVSLEGLSDTDITTPVAGEKLVYDGTNWVNLEAYAFVETVYFTSNGTFTKASYPWLRAVRVRLVGGGGASRTVPALSAGQASAGAGAGGGAFAESFITDIAGLGTAVSVVVGAGGLNAGDTTGGSGGESSFGDGETYEVSAGGGFGTSRTSLTGDNVVSGGNPGQVATGDLEAAGGAGGGAFAFDTLTVASSGAGGGSQFSGGSPLRVRSSAGGGQDGVEGTNYGGGASGPVAIGVTATAQDGKDGGPGIVILELYA